MTAQIGVINKKCIALATDSAVTLGRGNSLKSFNTADKLFQLSKHVPVGIMIYNNAEFLGVPWELIIKQYRLHLGEKKLDYLNDYVQDFFSFIKELPVIKEKNIENNIISIANNHVNVVLNRVSEKLQGVVNAQIVKDSILNEFKAYRDFIKSKGSKFDNQEYRDWLATYNNIIIELIKIKINVKDAKIIDTEVNFILECIKEAILSEQYSEVLTGIVFAGYGEKQWYPRLYEYETEGIIGNEIKVREIKRPQIGIDEDGNENNGTIITFAQSDMALNFLCGINPIFEKAIVDATCQICSSLAECVQETIDFNGMSGVLEITDDMRNILDTSGQSIFNTLYQHINKVKYENFINPFLNMVESLDKSQAAELAESLVNLTSFKRKMSMDTETVGGPVDVAIISKGDGFVWIKRKHYFDISLNDHFKSK